MASQDELNLSANVRAAVQKHSALSSWSSVAVRPRLVPKSFSQKSVTVVITSNLAIRVWSIKCRRKKKLIAQFDGKSRDERFEPN